jgi:DNA-binding Lrp family transcriptional regulator
MAIEARKHTHHHWGTWVWIKWKAGAPEDAWGSWKDVKEIKEAWSTTGEWDCALWIEIDNPGEVERLVWKEIRSNKWVEKTDTHWAKKYW